MSVDTYLNDYVDWKKTLAEKGYLVGVFHLNGTIYYIELHPFYTLVWSLVILVEVDHKTQHTVRTTASNLK